MIVLESIVEETNLLYLISFNGARLTDLESNVNTVRFNLIRSRCCVLSLFAALDGQVGIQSQKLVWPR